MKFVQAAVVRLKMLRLLMDAGQVSRSLGCALMGGMRGGWWM
ncbi:hypothetical protein [Occallatibacter riparius]|nr:hypothetical protein [Occallatibacter riparius]